ncbi:unnamed protein product [Clonostachys rosea f. rosea IK726]|uniref:Proline dehydrogenase n=2 Tax=Bionectria ochroleuca TaxID=29856 RepID=A0A0B7KBP1_BIOOC|nr:unnamed protein product [Clonostachys rosea f. rosea IK726]
MVTSRRLIQHKVCRDAVHGVRHLSTTQLVRSPPHPSSASVSSAVSSSATTSTKSPLSVLPTGVLLRSFFINAVSSRPYLLSPSLYILSKISKSKSGVILNVDRNPLLRWIMKNTFYKQFCAGESGRETRSTMDLLQNLGFRGTILTYAKETVFDFHSNSSFGQGVSNSAKEGENCPSIEAWRTGNMETVNLLQEGDQLAMKLSGAGPRVTNAFAEGKAPPQQFLDALEEICSNCNARKAQILVDAESQQFQWGIMRVTIDLMRKYNTTDKALIFNTYQAYLKSTPSTLRTHMQTALDEGFTLGVKVVRGAYMASDPRGLIHDTKENTDDAYNAIAQGFLKQQYEGFGVNGRAFPASNLFLASHNKFSLVEAYKTHMSQKRQGLPTVPVGFAQLHGMSDDVSFELLKMKASDAGLETPDIYKCSTWGTLKECMAYLMRRAAENRDAVGRTVDEYAALKTELGRRMGLSA